MEVDGCPTPDLESFLDVVRDKQDGSTVKLKHIDLKGKVGISHLRVDLKYWPTYDLNRVCKPLSEFDPNAEKYSARCNWMREAVKSGIVRKSEPHDNN